MSSQDSPNRQPQEKSTPVQYTGRSNLIIGSSGLVETFDGTLKGLRAKIESSNRDDSENNRI